jgi:hypothetical protein
MVSTTFIKYFCFLCYKQASKPIPRNTPIEISPVLLFTQSEYEEHGIVFTPSSSSILVTIRSLCFQENIPF